MRELIVGGVLVLLLFTVGGVIMSSMKPPEGFGVRQTAVVIVIVNLVLDVAVVYMLAVSVLVRWFLR